MKIFQINEMYKFSKKVPSVEVENDYFYLEQIQNELMHLVSKKNTKNEMIVKFIGQLEGIKSKQNQYAYEFNMKNPDWIKK